MEFNQEDLGEFRRRYRGCTDHPGFRGSVLERAAFYCLQLDAVSRTKGLSLTMIIGIMDHGDKLRLIDREIIPLLNQEKVERADFIARFMAGSLQAPRPAPVQAPRPFPAQTPRPFPVQGRPQAPRPPAAQAHPHPGSQVNPLGSRHPTPVPIPGYPTIATVPGHPAPYPPGTIPAGGQNVGEVRVEGPKRPRGCRAGRGRKRADGGGGGGGVQGQGGSGGGRIGGGWWHPLQ
jgi:uncharacterized membrane protein YgcG